MKRGSIVFWERFYNLCLEHETKPNAVCRELGFSTAVSTKWKKGAVPSSEYVSKIAAYFNVTTDYLLGNSEIKEKPTADTGDELSNLDKQLIDAMRGLSDDQKRFLLAQIEVTLKQ